MLNGLLFCGLFARRESWLQQPRLCRASWLHLIGLARIIDFCLCAAWTRVMLHSPADRASLPRLGFAWFRFVDKDLCDATLMDARL